MPNALSDGELEDRLRAAQSNAKPAGDEDLSQHGVRGEAQMEKSTEVDGAAVPAMQDAMEAVRSQAEAVARSQAGSIVASTVPLLNDVASLLVRAHDEGQRSITGGPTVPDPSLLTPRFSDPLVCTTGGTEAQAVAAAHQRSILSREAYTRQ